MRTKWNIKKILKEIVIGVLILFVISNVFSYIRKPDLESTTFPQTKSQLIDGSYFETSKVQGKPLLVHLWALWCPTCKLEASNIQALSKNYEVLTIAVKSGSDEALKKYMYEKGFNFKVINDIHGKWAEEFKIEAFPTTFIYDQNGELTFTEVGYTTTAGLLARMGMIDNY
jgi:thiol-disulfide isomerase/thioredoxin